MKKTKLLTSVAALALVLGLGACNETTEEDTPSTGDDYTEPESVTDYTVSFSFTAEGSATTLPSYATAYIIGDWDGWKEFLPLEQTGAATYSYTFNEISTGTHEYKGVMQYTYKEVSWDCAEIITDDEGGNATFTVSGLDEGSQSITEELRVTSLATYQNPDELFSGVAKTHNYKGTYADITYVSTVGATYKEYLEDESVLHTEEVLASREISYYTYYEGYFTDDVVAIKTTSVYGESSPSHSYYLYLNSDDSDYYYIFMYSTYSGSWSSYYGSPFQQKWNDNYNSLFWASTYSNIYFKFDHDELIDDEYVAVYSQSDESANLYFQVFGVDALMQSQYSASYNASRFTHEYSYFFPEDERLISDYHEYSISWDWQDGYNSDYTGPESEDATVYLQDEEAFLVADEIGSIDEEAMKAYATEVYNTIYSGAAG